MDSSTAHVEEWNFNGIPICLWWSCFVDQWNEGFTLIALYCHMIASVDCVNEALENTTTAVGSLPENELSIGQELMQVDRAYEYIQNSRNSPFV
ncbi:hypothetical protein FRX31_008704, partial [Thalictrum thalictroides]